MKTIHLIAITVVALILGLCAAVSAGESVLAENEAAFLDMINEARANPLGTAEALGMDPDQILQDFPEMQDVLTEGLPPLTLNQHLYEAASSHTNDMLTEGYYAHDSADGRTYEDRIRNAGYLPLASGESLGLVAFSNFIDPAERVRSIFETMFREQLDPTSGEEMNILNPELTEVGISLGTGTMDVGGHVFNVYMATCDFGRGVDAIAMEVTQLINQIRSRPLDVIASLGMDPDQVLADHPELHDVLTNGLPPLAFDFKLYAAATSHAGDMLAAGYFSHESPDGRTFQDRIADAGYEAEMAAESLGMLSYRTDDESTGGEAQSILYDLFVNELEGEADYAILSSTLQDVGVGFTGGASEPFATICSDAVFFLVADFGTPSESTGDSPTVMGVVYEDRDGDCMYDQGEGLASISVNIIGDSCDAVVSTNGAGGFSKDVSPGIYQITCEWGESQVVKTVEISEENVLVVVRFPQSGGEEAVE